MAEENVSNREEAADQNSQFIIQKVYTKDISFETPNSPEIFREDWQPTVDLQLASEAKLVEDDVFDVTLSITITVKVNDKIAYLVEVQQSGIFAIVGFEKALVEQMLGTACPNILFPFARETVSDLVTRGGFPQLLLAPVNFDALYRSQLEQAELEKHQSDSTH